VPAARNGVNNNLERQRDRLDRLETTLTMKFAWPEQALTRLEVQRGALGMAGL